MNETQAGPPSPTFLTLVLKTMSGIGGGLVGMAVLLGIFLGASTILQSAWSPDLIANGGDPMTKSPLFIFVFMAMIFLTSLAANVVGSLLFTYVESEKYSRRTTALYQIFFINLAIFVLLAPIYIVLDARNLLQMISFLAGFHVLLAGLASMMVLEIVGNLQYALIGVYGVIFSFTFSTGTILSVFEFTGRNPTIILFAALPIIWISLGFMTTITEMFYRWLWSLYGIDFLMSRTTYGIDYGEAEVEEEVKEDLAGADFLNK